MLAKPEYFSLPDEVCCWPGRRGGAAGTGSQRKQLAGALRRDGAKWQSVRKSLPLGERRCGGIEEELAAGRATMRLHRGKACRWASYDAAASWKSLPLGEDDAAAPGRCKAASGRCSMAAISTLLHFYSSATGPILPFLS